MNTNDNKLTDNRCCIKCNQIKPIEDFKFKNNYRRRKCSSCQTEIEAKRSRLKYLNNKKRINANQKVYRDRNPRICILGRLRRRAKEENIIFNLELSDIVIPDKCPILNIDLLTANGKMNDNSASADKIIPELGYTQKNTKIISWKANRIKSDATKEELLKIINYIELNDPRDTDYQI